MIIMALPLTFRSLAPQLDQRAISAQQEFSRSVLSRGYD